MADESGSVWSITRRATITTIVTAIVGGLISWIAGWLPAIWQAIQTAAAWTWSLITLSVPVPLVVLVILALPFVIWIGRAARQTTAPDTPEASQEPPEPPLSGSQADLLRLLAQADGANVHFDDAASHLRLSRLVLQQVCEALTQRGYIKPENHFIRGLHIALTPLGRDFVIEQGFRLGRLPRDW